MAPWARKDVFNSLLRESSAFQGAAKAVFQAKARYINGETRTIGTDELLAAIQQVYTKVVRLFHGMWIDVRHATLCYTFTVLFE